MKIYCCQCEREVEARQVTGKVVYPHRQDLWPKKYWRCDGCTNYTGAHKKSGEPLGVIPTAQLRRGRQRLHAIIDPLWKDGGYQRAEIYQAISEHLGEDFHVANIRTLGEMKDIAEFVQRRFG